MEMKKYKLNDVCLKITDGSHFSPKAVDFGYPMYSVKDMNEFGFNDSDYKMISEDDFKSLVAAGCRPQKDDVLIAKDGSYLKYAFVCKEEKDEVILSSIAILRPNKDIIDPTFFSFLLRNPSVKKSMKYYVSGTALPRIVLDNFRKMEINIPGLSEQKKIGDMLSDFDKRIENLRAQNRVLEQTAKTIYDYTFLQCAGHQTTYNKTLNRNIPADWEVKSVGDFAELITKGTTPTTLGFNFEENGVNFVKVECIENGRLITENLAHISKEAHEKLKRSNLHENDILVTIAGRLASPCVVPKSVLPANTNQAVGIIRLTKENQKYVQYVFYCIFDPAMQNKLKGINAQSIQKNLTLPNLGNIPIAVPDDKTLEEFNSHVIPIFRKQQVNSLQIETLTTQRNTLLPLLMTGQVEVE